MTGRVFTDACEGCTLRLANGQDPVCDSSGVIAISDYPESRVIVCPEWPCDQDEPLAYWQAIDSLGYDQMPPTMQQRIRDNVMAEVARTPREARNKEVGYALMAGAVLVGFLIAAALVVGYTWPWGLS